MPFDHAEVTLCASSRFYGEVASIAEELRAAGLTVCTPRLDFSEGEVDRATKQSLTTKFCRRLLRIRPWQHNQPT